MVRATLFPTPTQTTSIVPDTPDINVVSVSYWQLSDLTFPKGQSVHFEHITFEINDLDVREYLLVRVIGFKEKDFKEINELVGQASITFSVVF